MVSAVIRKRLSLGMPLQMDPTIIYGLKKFGGNLTKKDLKTPNSYNTYLTTGLPPGPICNPGLAALKAAISPSGADYLYCVSRNDGAHGAPGPFLPGACDRGPGVGFVGKSG